MDGHRRGEMLVQGLGLPPGGAPLGGGAEFATMALDLSLACRWTATLLGALMTVTVLLAHSAHAG